MAGAYVKIKKIKFRNQNVIDYGSAGANGIVESDYVMVQNGTDSTIFPKESIHSIDVGATVAHLDTAFGTADALFT